MGTQQTTESFDFERTRPIVIRLGMPHPGLVRSKRFPRIGDFV